MTNPALFNRWANGGGENFLRKVTRGWLVEIEGYRVPKVFRTKREAVAYAANLAPIMAKREVAGGVT